MRAPARPACFRPRAPRPTAARATSARDTSPRCRGSGSRAAPLAAARPCSCLRRQARLWQRSSSGNGVEEVEEAGEAYYHASRVLDLDAVPGDEAGDRTEHRDPVIPVRVDPPPRRPVGHAANAKTVAACLDADADCAQRLRHRVDSIALLHAQLLSAAHDAFPACEAGGEREERE